MDFVSLGVGLLGICVTYYLMRQQNRQQAQELNQLKQQERRRLIENNYPRLVADIRDSVTNIVHVYRAERDYTETFFHELVLMNKESTLKIIESLDVIIYQRLKYVLGLLGELELCNAQRMESEDRIKILWKNWVEDNYYDLPKMTDTPENFTKRVWAFWEMWRDEDESSLARIKEACDRVFASEDNTPVLWGMLHTEFKRIAEGEWIGLRTRYNRVNQTLISTVQDEILPQMENTLKSLGEGLQVI